MSEAILPSQVIDKTSHQEKEWSIAKVIYTILMALALLSHIWLMVIGAGIDNIPTYIWTLRLLPVPFAIWLGKLWKDRGFQILSLYFLLFFFRCFIPNPGSIFSVEMSESILSALWLFAACYGIGKVLKGDELKQFLLIILSIWTIWMIIYSSLGIYTAWTDYVIEGFGDSYIGIKSSIRMVFIYLATAAGAILSISALIILTVIISYKNKVIKALFSLAIIPIILTLGVTNTRTAFASFSIGVGFCAFVLIYHLYIERGKKKKISWMLGATAMVLTCAAVLFVLMQITPVLNHFKARGFIPSAFAEGTEKTKILLNNRGFTNYSESLTERIGLWKEIIQFFTHNPVSFFIGESKILPLRNISDQFGHTHCLYIQIFLESGIIGLLLFFSFIVTIAIAFFKCVSRGSHKTVLCLLPVLLLSLLIGDLADCFLWLRSSQCIMVTVFFIITGMISGNYDAIQNVANDAILKGQRNDVQTKPRDQKDQIKSQSAISGRNGKDIPEWRRRSQCYF